MALLRATSAPRRRDLSQSLTPKPTQVPELRPGNTHPSQPPKLPASPSMSSTATKKSTSMVSDATVAAMIDSLVHHAEVVPRVSAFYGIVIYMYWDERDHPVPHFHAYHAAGGASVSADGVVLAGALDARSHALVVEWAQLHAEELLANWDRARPNQPLVSIPPLT